MSTYPPNTLLPVYGAYTQTSAKAADLEWRLALPGAINVKDVAYGAVGDGVTDDTAAIQAAMTAAANGVLLLPPGTYKLTAPVVGVTGVRVIGYGATLTASTRIAAYLSFSNVSRWSVEGVRFDLGQSVLPTYTLADYNAAVHPGSTYNVGIYATGCSGASSIVGCTFTNLYTNAIQLFQNGGALHITRNEFTSPVQAQGYLAEHIHVNTSSTDLTITENLFDNAAPSGPSMGVPAVFGSGTTGKFSVTDNVIHYSGRDSTYQHQLAAIAFYGDSVNVTVRNNTILNTLAQAVRLSAVNHAEVCGNYMTMASVANVGDQMISCEGSYAYSPGVVGIQDHKIHHNYFRDDYDTTRLGVAIIALDYAIPSTDIWVTENEFVNLAKSVAVFGPYRGVRIERNQIRGNNGGSITAQQDAGGQAVTALHGVTEAQSEYRDLYVRGNAFDLASTGADIIKVDITKSPAYAGTLGDHDISDNVIRLTGTQGVGTGIILHGINPINGGRATVRRNTVVNLATGFDLTYYADLVVEDNAVSSVTTAFANATGTRVQRARNRLSIAGAASGRSTLVAGTVTVNTTEVQTGDNIRLTRDVAGGTLGHVSVGTITSGTSFTITSSSATDTSTVFWEIVH